MKEYILKPEKKVNKCEKKGGETMALESSVVSEDWMTALSVSFFKGKRERTECKSYRGVNLLSVVSM